jgi:DNA recombination-dependent growth factor C|tara:strand:+ start:3681 stop:4040 length:360 start_codon:yes stop_codon:yes gene_type:complete
MARRKLTSVRIDPELLDRLPTGRGDMAKSIRSALRFWLELKDKPQGRQVPREAELKAMKEQVAQTQAIGRNLNQLIREWYAIREGKDSHIDQVEWENLHRLITETARDMQKTVQYWSRT